MAASLTRLPWWLLGGKDKEPPPNGSSLNSSSERGLGLRELDNVIFPLVKGSTMGSSSRKDRTKWKSREERRIDEEYGVVLVPSDGGCLSGSESDDSDWSIGWLEPHAPDFQNDNEADNSFAVLVRCYRHECKESETTPDNQFLGTIKYLSTEYTDGKKYVEQWLSSLQYC